MRMIGKTKCAFNMQLWVYFRITLVASNWPHRKITHYARQSDIKMIIERFNERTFRMLQMPLISRKSRSSFVRFNASAVKPNLSHQCRSYNTWHLIIMKHIYMTSRGLRWTIFAALCISYNKLNIFNIVTLSKYFNLIF